MVNDELVLDEGLFDVAQHQYLVPLNQLRAAVAELLLALDKATEGLHGGPLTGLPQTVPFSEFESALGLMFQELFGSRNDLDDKVLKDLYLWSTGDLRLVRELALDAHYRFDAVRKPARYLLWQLKRNGDWRLRERYWDRWSGKRGQRREAVDGQDQAAQ